MAEERLKGDLTRIALSWYALARNVAGLAGVPGDDAGLLDEVIYYTEECPGEPGGFTISSILGTSSSARFQELVSMLGLRPSALTGLPSDSLAHLFSLAGVLAEAELFGDAKAPVYRLWLIEEIVEVLASRLEDSDDYCSSLLGRVLSYLAKLDKEVLESG